MCVKILTKTEQSYRMTALPSVENIKKISKLKILQTMNLARTMTKISVFTAHNRMAAADSAVVLLELS